MVVTSILLIFVLVVLGEKHSQYIIQIILSDFWSILGDVGIDKILSAAIDEADLILRGKIIKGDKAKLKRTIMINKIKMELYNRAKSCNEMIETDYDLSASIPVIGPILGLILWGISRFIAFPHTFIFVLLTFLIYIIVAFAFLAILNYMGYPILNFNIHLSDFSLYDAILEGIEESNKVLLPLEKESLEMRDQRIDIIEDIIASEFEGNFKIHFGRLIGFYELVSLMV